MADFHVPHENGGQYTGQINFPAEKYQLQNILKQFLRIYKMQYFIFHFGNNVLLYLLWAEPLSV